ncbi:hypothetical protein BaRGS_00014341 [Batillaria attramentaria]|uniref:Indoleamine 2,3-dioxygenase n=1 Tax=Batillaria attramentaria TaxID=370345 RepID=A0ABD0L4W7_9CAEN
MDLRDFHISEKTGFCLEDPLEVLPPYFEEWNRITKSLPELLKKGTVREVVDKMPLLDCSQLEGHRQKRLANLQLSLIASAYVWGKGKDVCKSIPECLAVPLYKVSQDVGLQTSCCHANRTLANWTLIDPNGNVRTLYPMLPGGKESIVAVINGVDAGDEETVISNLNIITDCVNNMTKTLSRMNGVLPMSTFLYDILPLCSGWGDTDEGIPDGLLFEGVSDKPIKSLDDTAAQSSAIPCVDALLCVTHPPERRDFQLRARSCMPRGHLRFIEAIEQRPNSLRDLVLNSSNSELLAAYNKCLEANAAFRTRHFQLFARYVIVAQKKKPVSGLNKIGQEADMDALPVTAEDMSVVTAVKNYPEEQHRRHTPEHVDEYVSHTCPERVRQGAPGSHPPDEAQGTTNVA